MERSTMASDQAGSLAVVGRQLPLDVLRGFALLGILFVNFEFFAYPAAVVPDYSRVAFPSTIDRVAAWLMQFCCDGKFILIFSFLFGYGLHVQMTRAEAAGESPLPRYRRRLLGLFCLGLLHATLLFVGDILVTYAILGLALIPFRKARPKWLVVGAAACWGLSIAGHAALGWAIAHFPQPAADPERILAIYRTGSALEIVAQRVEELAGLYLVTPVLFMPQVFGMFLLGLAAAKRGLLRDLGAERATWRRVFVWSVPVALIGNAAYVSLLAGQAGSAVAGDFAAIAGMAGRALFAPFGAAAYVAGLALLLHRERFRRWLAPLATDGRMSLTNYIWESAICCFLFHSYGFQLFGHIGPADGVVLVFMIFGFQMMFSDWWLLRFRVGPLEWLLRSWVEKSRRRLSDAPIPA